MRKQTFKLRNRLKYAAVITMKKSIRKIHQALIRIIITLLFGYSSL